MDQETDYDALHHGYQQGDDHSRNDSNVDDNGNSINNENNHRDKEDEVKERRSSIQHIMQHPKLTNKERRHSIQILMDARRRSSFGSTFAEAAKNVAAEFVSCNSNYASSNNSCVDGENGGDVDTHTGCAAMSDSYCDQEKKGNTFVNSTSTSTCKRAGFDTSDKRQEVSQKKNEDGLEHEQEQETHSDSNTSSISSLWGDSCSIIQRTKPAKHQMSSQSAMIAFTLSGEPTGDPKQMELNRPQCSHYKRNCSIISPCCGMVFGCRICHDECEHQSKPFMKMLQGKNEVNKNRKRREIKETSSTSVENTQQTTMNNASFSRRLSLNSLAEGGDEVHHDINRKDISEIICRECFTRQSSKR